MNRTSRVAGIILFALLSCQQVFCGPTAASLDPSLRLEQQRLQFEERNEARKNRTELIKSVIAGLSLLLPLAFGAYTLRSQARQAFELKAAEIVMAAPSLFAVGKKAAVLAAIFPGRLPADFAKRFDPKEFVTDGPSVESKLELLKLQVANPGREGEIVKLWRRMYPGDALEQLFPGDFANRPSLVMSGSTQVTSSHAGLAPAPGGPAPGVGV